MNEGRYFDRTLYISCEGSKSVVYRHSVGGRTQRRLRFSGPHLAVAVYYNTRCINIKCIKIVKQVEGGRVQQVPQENAGQSRNARGENGTALTA